MTRKDYEKFADMLAELRRVYGTHDTALEAVEMRLCLIFADDNRFDQSRFEAAAQPN